VIIFSPLLGWPWLVAFGVLSGIVIIAALGARASGAMWRAIGFGLLFLILANPSYLRQTHSALPNIALVVVDQSQSMAIGARSAMAARALAALQREASKIPNLELRVATVPPAADGGTALFAAVRNAVAAIPQPQLGGVIAITDGEAADAPKTTGLKASGFEAPFSALLTASGEETDRELRLINAPAYGLVGQNVKLTFTVIDHGMNDAGALAPVILSADGTQLWSGDIPVGQPGSVDVPVSHAGPMVVTLQVAALPGEVSKINNQVVFSLNGVRKRLEVLLISGTPDQGERSWRVLLKSDPAIELVHFTILRTPGELMDALPNQLALVPFPVEQLFNTDIGKFDLIILDQFNADGLLPPQYLSNIASHVQQGGALLVEVGPEFATDDSLAFTPLRMVLPAVPAAPGTIIESFSPRVTELGGRHPVTAPFSGTTLSPWYRQEIATPTQGDVLMSGANDAPLLILAGIGQGRVAMLLSDQFWLWTRGGGQAGPALPLLRRCVHWLLREPALEAEALTAGIENGEVTVQRKTLGATYPGDAAVIAPDGEIDSMKLTQTGPGNYAGSRTANMPGVWKVTEGGMTTYAAQAAENAAEYQDLATTSALIQPVARKVIWLGRDPEPALAALLENRYASEVTGSRELPLLPPLPAMAAVLALLGMAWWRERG
jgi:hypothetical protein